MVRLAGEADHGSEGGQLDGAGGLSVEPVKLDPAARVAEAQGHEGAAHDGGRLQLVLALGQDLHRARFAVAQVHHHHPAERRVLVGEEEEAPVHLVHEGPGVREAGEDRPDGGSRPGQVADEDLALVARALGDEQQEEAPVPRGDPMAEQLPLLGPLVDERVLVLGLTEDVVVDPGEVALVARRDRAGLREARVEEALVVGGPGEGRELGPEQAIGEIPSTRDIADEDLLPVAAAPRERVGHERAVAGERGDGEGDRPVGAELVRVEQHALGPGRSLAHVDDRLVLESGVARVEGAAPVTLRDGDPRVVEELLDAAVSRFSASTQAAVSGSSAFSSQR